MSYDTFVTSVGGLKQAYPMSRGEWKIHCFINIYSKLPWVNFLSPMRPCLDTRFRILSITNAERTSNIKFLNIKVWCDRHKWKKREEFSTNILQYFDLVNYFYMKQTVFFLFPRLFKARVKLCISIGANTEISSNYHAFQYITKIFSVILLQDNWKLQTYKTNGYDRRALIWIKNDLSVH